MSGTRTDALLTQLNMTETQYALARRGQIINGEGIDIEEELMTYYPLQGHQAHVQEVLF
jgi:hypothetical protein